MGAREVAGGTKKQRTGRRNTFQSKGIPFIHDALELVMKRAFSHQNSRVAFVGEILLTPSDSPSLSDREGKRSATETVPPLPRSAPPSLEVKIPRTPAE